MLAAAARLLDLGLFRVGGEEYAEENSTYGLATLRREHVRVRQGRLVFDYTAKAGMRRLRWSSDPTVAEVVDALRRRRDDPNPELFAYRSGDGLVGREEQRPSTTTCARCPAWTCPRRTSAPGTPPC